jgi:spore maturation protein CgeB
MNSNSHKKILGILDSFTYNSLSLDLDITEIESSAPIPAHSNYDFLLVESAWFGKNKSWHNKINKKSTELCELVDWCKSHSIPTVFLAKEDPIHFDRFLQTASLFDAVFTTDINCISDYKRALGHTKIYLLPFAFQPKLHHPIERFKRLKEASFAGSYYVRYKERAKDLDRLIDTLKNILPVSIYDRYQDTEDVNYKFPERFKSLIKGNLPFERIDEAYKGYAFGLNLNTVKNSESMFARRVFEIAASGSIVISNISPGINSLFGDLVVCSDDEDEIKERVQLLVNNDLLRSKVATASVRKVLLDHTYKNRLDRIYEKVLGEPIKNRLPDIVFISKVSNEEEYYRVAQMMLLQKISHWTAYIFSTTTFSLAEIDSRIQVVFEAQPQHINNFVDQFFGKWIALFHPSDYYGPHYVLDLLLATNYTDAIVIGKGSFFHSTSSENKSLLTQPQLSYQEGVSELFYRSSIFFNALQNNLTRELLDFPENTFSPTLKNYACDYFSYCCDAFLDLKSLEDVRSKYSYVDDEDLEAGLSINALYEKSDASRVNLPFWLNKKSLRLQRVAELFDGLYHPFIQVELDQFGLHIISDAPDEMEIDLRASRSIPIDELILGGQDKFFVEAKFGMPLQLLIQFENSQHKPIDERLFELNQNHKLEPPPGSHFVKFVLRLTSSGSTRITRFVLDWAPQV